MAETEIELTKRLENAVTAGFRGRLLDRGLARGLIWTDGQVPEGAPEFIDTLTEDLLDYAHTLIATAVRLRSINPDAAVLERTFLVAGEAIEAAIHKGELSPDATFHRVSAAVAFHLARYSARAYSLVPPTLELVNVAPIEIALVYLLRRRLDSLHQLIARHLTDPANQDEAVAARLQSEEDFNEDDAINAVLTSAFMRALALFDHAITTGRSASARLARERLEQIASEAGALNAVTHWWTATLASQLVDELWKLSLHQQVGQLSASNPSFGEWLRLRRSYIQRLRRSSKSEIELWPSQLGAVRRVLDDTDDLVVALPTSAGKTRIAELCILRALSAGRRAIYVTPLRALSAQIERDLAAKFRPLGPSVSTLYGAAGIEAEDTEALRSSDIVVATPEKIDFALRNDPSIIDSVGIVVLDEGHMLGPGEREVRYEALVQRLLRREDANNRRVVCLSALFPSPDEMADLTAWLRQDAPGEPVHSTWRPTRQRFGTLRWAGQAARLDVQMEQESPYVQRFIEAKKPPSGSRRRRGFPAEKNELTLAAAWRFVSQGKDVMVYCSIRKSVETLGKCALECIDGGLLPSLTPADPEIASAVAIGKEWLGDDHPAVKCLAHGIALHHGGLPRQFLSEVERLLRLKKCPVVIASPTLAQGLNLSASVLLVPSIWRNAEVIPASEFANVAGRAGRAFVDVEGLVIHIIWDKHSFALRTWAELLRNAKAPKVRSGLLQLAWQLYQSLAVMANIPVGEVLEYLTGNDDGWDFNKPRGESELTEDAWDRDVASLDSAVLALLDADVEQANLITSVDSVLEKSLFARQLELLDDGLRRSLRSLVDTRTANIWANTSVAQRRGFHAAGIGLKAGLFLDTHLAELIGLLVVIEAGIASGDPDVVADATVSFAQRVLEIAPFKPPKELPTDWVGGLRAWMMGMPSANVVNTCGEGGIEFLQEAVSYRLPWAMEAVRVHGRAMGDRDAAELSGTAALAVEAGSPSRSVMLLLRAGLNSREAAIAAVEGTAATFDTRDQLRQWLRSADVLRLSGTRDWPSSNSHSAWLDFLRDERSGDRREWTWERQTVDVDWKGDIPKNGTWVVLELSQRHSAIIHSPEFEPLGVVGGPLNRSVDQVISAIALNGKAVVSFYGPSLEA